MTWPIVKLDSVADRGSGHTPSQSYPEYWGDGVKWVSLADSSALDKQYIQDTAKKISALGLRHSSAVLHPKGTVIVSRDAGVGKSAILGDEMAVSQHFIAWQCDEKKLHNAYLYQWLQSHKREFERMAVGSTVKTIGLAYFEKLSIPLPPIEIQVKVASILADWDTAIEKTKRLIGAKDRSQRGWMQKLVSDQLFPEHRLSEFVHRVNRKNTAGNGHPLTISGRAGLISQSHYFDKRIAAEATEHYTLLNRGEFAYNKSYSAGYPYGAIKRLDAYDEGIVSTLYLCFALNPDAALLSDYLIQFCEVGGFNHQIHKVAQEGARNHGLLNVAAHDFFAMKLPVPPIEEQSRVIAILGDAGRELSLLRKSLDQLRQQKRGLMQKLLTGQWRVTVPTSKEVPHV